MVISCTGAVHILPLECLTWNMVSTQIHIPTLRTASAQAVFVCRSPRTDNTHGSPAKVVQNLSGLSCFKRKPMDKLDLGDTIVVSELVYSKGHSDVCIEDIDGAFIFDQQQVERLYLWLGRWMVERKEGGSSGGTI